MTIDSTLQKRLYIGVGIAVVLMAFFVFILWRNTRTEPAPQQQAQQQTPTEPAFRRRLDGTPLTDAAQQNNYPVAVMIENSSDAWPLAGLDQAQIVYETIAEGSIPRFVALFSSDATIEKIGPVRSARPYFLDLVEPYRAVYMHVGGSPEALKTLRSTDRVINVDQFFKDKYFWRAQNRYAPHNVYTSSLLIKKGLFDMNLIMGIEYPTYKYTVAEPTSEQRPTAVKDITVNFTTKSYQARWKFDRDFNAYTRYQQDALFTMEDASLVRAKNVIVMQADMQVLDSVGRRAVTTTGEGKAWVFRDGTVIAGTWKRATTKDLIRYFDDQGNEISLNAGSTWVEIVPDAKMLEY